MQEPRDTGNDTASIQSFDASPIMKLRAEHEEDAERKEKARSEKSKTDAATSDTSTIIQH